MSAGSTLDALLYRGSARRRAVPPGPAGTRWLDTASGRLRLFDSGERGRPVIVFAPDGPCVIEHYRALIEALRGHARVICFDLPGFGFSYPGAAHTHSIADGADAVLAVLEALDLRGITLALSCVNGYYGIAAAARSPDRIAKLVLSQTPSLAAMKAWTARIVPKPIRVPIIGQTLNYATRRKAADGWYRVALAKREDRAAFQSTADEALRHGACYCFAGVVQGMSREPAAPASLSDVQVPVTLVWGGRDRSHAQTDPASILDLLPQAHIEHFAECGHFPELEDPSRYAGLVLGLLAGTTV